MIQSSNATTNAATINCVFNANVTSGNLIIVSANWESATGTPTVTDTRSTSYAQAAIDTSHTVRVAVYIGTLSSSGANTVTFAETSATFLSVTCTEFPPNWTTTVDASGSGVTTGTPATVTSPSITTTLNTDLLYSHIGGFQSAGQMDVNSASLPSWTQVSNKDGADSQAAAFAVAGTNGSYSMTWNNATNTQVTTMIVAFKSKSLAITSAATAPDGGQSVAYDYTLLAAGGKGAYTWSITSGALQPGLSLNSSTGEISGTPSYGPTNSITFQVADTNSNTATATISLKVASALNSVSLLQGKSTAVTANTLAFTSNVTAGSLLIAITGWNNTDSKFTYCTDTAGTPLQLVAARTQLPVSGQVSIQQIFAGIAPTGGADTISCGTLADIYSIAEFSGVMYAANDDTLVTRGTTTSPATVTSGSLTTLIPNALITGLCYANSGSSTMTVDSPFTAVGSTAFSMRLGYRVVTTVTGYTMSCDEASNTSGNWMFLLAGFRPGGGAAAPGPSGVRHRVVE
ncbi:MAG TPA: putative Ig domain-containing protein [Candidatus Sulfopaludibacter sp.]|nr:putative Ig domain-containing protein [Candidatus Sulfopaludibacter sp.]